MLGIRCIFFGETSKATLFIQFEARLPNRRSSVAVPQERIPISEI